MLDSLASNKTKNWLDMEVFWISLARVGLPVCRWMSLMKQNHSWHPSPPLLDLQPWQCPPEKSNLFPVLMEKYWRETKMALYKLLLILVMHHTVFELTDATQCPELTKAQLEDRPCPLLHYYNVLACQNRVLYFSISYLNLHFVTY